MGPSKSRVPAFSTFSPSRYPSGTRARSVFAAAAATSAAGNNSATPLSARCHKFVLPRTPRDINNSVCKGARARAPASLHDWKPSRSSLFDETRSAAVYSKFHLSDPSGESTDANPRVPRAVTNGRSWGFWISRSRSSTKTRLRLIRLDVSRYERFLAIISYHAYTKDI